MCYCLKRNTKCTNRECLSLFDLYAHETPQNITYDFFCPHCNQELSYVVKGTSTYDPVNQIPSNAVVASPRNSSDNY